MPLKAMDPVVMNHRVCTLIMSLSEPAYAISDFQKKNYHCCGNRAQLCSERS